MFLNSRKVSLTLFCSLALVLALASVAQADLARPVARDHAILNRMLRRRADPLASLLGTDGAASDAPTFGDDSGSQSGSSTAPSSTPASSAAAPSSSSSSAPSSSPPSSSAPPSSSPSSSSTSTSSSAPASSTSSTSSGSSSSSSSSNAVSDTSSSTNTSSSPAATSAAAPSQTAAAQTSQQDSQTQQEQDDDASNTSAKDPSKTSGPATVTGVVTVGATATSGAAVVSSASTLTPSKTAITVLGVIAGSAMLVVVIWTIIRKTKFKASGSFEDRMNPIEWQPDNVNERSPGAAAGLQRTASAASHGSFHSSSAHDDGSSYAHAGYGATTLQPIPDHDFTAGASLAPVGGYADLARGPSPQPQQMAQLGRGPSMNRPDFGYEYNNSHVRY